MSIIIIFADFDYWGDNGRCTDEWVVKVESEEEAIRECCDQAVWHDIGFKITGIVGAENSEELTKKINAAIIARSACDKLKRRIETLERYISETQKWLDNVESETMRRTASLEEYKLEVENLKGILGKPLDPSQTM